MSACTFSYVYDSANRLTSINGTTLYTYNGLGDRLSQTVNGVSTNYTLDLNTGLTQVLNDGTTTYTYGLGRISQTSTTTEYFLGDALGSMRQLTNSAGDVTLAKAYDPYGNVTQTSGESHSEFAYTGEQQDASGLTYLRARYYNPADGRFQSRDTWAGDYYTPETFNYWNYVGNNPINIIDPSGNCYPPLEFLRGIEGGNCANLDQAYAIRDNPNATTSQRNWAKAYIGVFIGSHAALLAGSGVLISAGTAAAVAGASPYVLGAGIWAVGAAPALVTVADVFIKGALIFGTITEASLLYKSIFECDQNAMLLLAVPFSQGQSILASITSSGMMPLTLSGGSAQINGGNTLIWRSIVTAIPALQVSTSGVLGMGAAGSYAMMTGNGGGGGRGPKLSPSESRFWNQLEKYKGNIRRSGSGSKTRYYQWDYTHGDIEVYNNNGWHLGSMEPSTGRMYKLPVPGRRIKL